MVAELKTDLLVVIVSYPNMWIIGITPNPGIRGVQYYSNPCGLGGGSNTSTH